MSNNNSNSNIYNQQHQQQHHKYQHFYSQEYMQRTLPSPNSLAERSMGAEVQRGSYRDLSNLTTSSVSATLPTGHYPTMNTSINGGLTINAGMYGNSSMPQPSPRPINYSVGEPSSATSMRYASTGSGNTSLASLTASSAAQHMEATGVTGSKRQRVSRACDACRRKKVRCDGVRPICGNCSAFHFECTYLDAAKKRGPPKGYIEAIEHRLRRMEKLLSGIVKHDPRLESVVQNISTQDTSEVDTEIHDLDGIQDVGAHDDDKRHGGGRRGRQTMAWGHRLEAMDRLLTQATQGLGFDEKLLAALNKEADNATELMREEARAGRNRSSSHSESLSDLEVMIDDEYDEQATPAVESRPQKHAQLTIKSNSEYNQKSQVAYDEHGNLRYMGGSSGAYLIMDRRVAAANSAQSQEQAAARLLQHLAMPSIPFRRLRADIELPPPEMSNRLISIYFARLHPFHPFVHKAAFLRCLRDRRRPPLLLLNAIYAIAARWANDPSLYAEPGKPLTAGQVFFDRARILLDDEYDRSELTTVQALIIMSFYQHGSSQSMGSWLLAGMAFRMAHDLGLHRDCERWGLDDLDRVEKETRRRVWWACFVVDSMTSAALGRPLAIDERDIDAQLPRIDEDEEVDLDAEEVATGTVSHNSSSPGRQSVSSDVSGGNSHPSGNTGQRRNTGGSTAGSTAGGGGHGGVAVAAALPGGHAGPNPPASVTMPTSNAQLSTGAGAKPSPVLYYIQLIKLSELMAKVLRNVYGPRAARNNLYEVASRMDVELETWVARLPVTYNYREVDFTYTSTTISPFTGLLHIFFDVTRILLHRPLIVLPTGTSDTNNTVDNINQEEASKALDDSFATSANQSEQQQQQQQQPLSNVGGWSSFRTCCDAAQRITRIADCMRVGGYLRCHGVIFIGYSLFQASMVHLNNAMAPDEAICRPARGHLALGLRALEELQKEWLSAQQCRAILLDLMEVRGVQLTEEDYGKTATTGSRRGNRRAANASSGSNRSRANNQARSSSEHPTLATNRASSSSGTSPVASAAVLKMESQSPTSLHGFSDMSLDQSLTTGLASYAQLSDSTANGTPTMNAATIANQSGQNMSSATSSLNATLFPPSYGLSDMASALFSIPGVQDGSQNKEAAAAAAAAAAALMMSNPQTQAHFGLSMPITTNATTMASVVSSAKSVSSHLNQTSTPMATLPTDPTMLLNPSTSVTAMHNQGNPHTAVTHSNTFWGMPSSLDLGAWQTYLNQWGLPNVNMSDAETSAGVVAEIPQIRPLTMTSTAIATTTAATATATAAAAAMTPNSPIQPTTLFSNPIAFPASTTSIITSTPLTMISNTAPGVAGGIVSSMATNTNNNTTSNANVMPNISTAISSSLAAGLLPQRGRPPQ